MEKKIKELTKNLDLITIFKEKDSLFICYASEKERPSKYDSFDFEGRGKTVEEAMDNLIKKIKD